MTRLISLLLGVFCIAATADLAFARGAHRFNLDQKWAREQEAQEKLDQRFKELDKEAAKFLKKIEREKGGREPGSNFR
jgi:hypothetical protein